jgi:hypothetical protein
MCVCVCVCLYIYFQKIFRWPPPRIWVPRGTYIHSIYIGCIIHLQRQQAYKDKGVLRRCLCICCRSSTTRISRGSARALAGSWQHRHASLHSHAALCTSTVTLTHRSRRASSNKRPIPTRYAPPQRMLPHHLHGRIPQASGPWHDTTQSNKPPILAAAYVCSRRSMLMV